MSMNPGSISLEGVRMPAWLVRYDKKGICTSPKTRDALLAAVSANPQAPVILFSHGWNNEYEEATQRYAGLLRHLEAHRTTYPGSGTEPIFVGILWPSTWLSFDKGPDMATTSVAGSRSDPFERFEQELAEQLEGDERARFYALVEQDRLDATQTKELVELTARAVKNDAGSPDSREGNERKSPQPADMYRGMDALQRLAGPVPDDSDELQEGGTLGQGPQGAVQDAGFLSFLDPRNALRVASVYQMKDRAGTVGWNGVAALLSDLLARSPAPVHVVGHSYGAKVVLSAIASKDLPRQVTSVLLLQPAVSHLCFAAEVPGREGAGGYVAVPQRVKNGLAMTCSAWDFPLHTVFHKALRRDDDLGELQVGAQHAGEAVEAGDPPSKYAALGGYGPRKARETMVNEMPAPGTPLPQLRAPGLIAFDGTKGKRVSSHGDVSTQYTAWLLHQQMVA
ncbi:alpha/beta hydrolase [Mitsuaria sp. TWR114]|uniref:alpha/beta hydrolase n=1 Tax=Mitsuaria sp. TWR114 TaxID=2601731 RepID=UPI0011BEAFDD|nr:alpha/beta hydrolase [Mitsuaria sp. TWR114]TXD94226.1 alpha/beta hydrolase [Mitsuaria sp. TWR114]